MESRLEVVLPKWGLTMSEATIVRWLRGEGDEIAEGDPLVEVETEKANAEVEAPAGGLLVELLAQPGAVVPVGQAIAVLKVAGGAGAEASQVTAPGSAPPAAGASPARSPAEAPAEVPAPSGVGAGAPVPAGNGRASPLARRVARELGIDLAAVEGTGAKGLITDADVRRAAASAPRAAESSGSRVEPLTKMRKAIAAAMARSCAEAPQLTLTREVGLVGARARAAGDISLTDVLAAVVARSLVLHPRLNAHLVGDQLEIFDDVNLGLAVALEEGLVTPVIRRAQALELPQLAAERRRLVELARSRRLRQTDLLGGTFTLTNLGSYGVEAFTPILNPPEVGILGVGAARPRPVVTDGVLGVGETCVLSLTFDHRAVDGAPAAELLAEIASALEDPTRIAEVVG